MEPNTPTLEKESPEPAQPAVVKIPLSKIMPNPCQPRRRFKTGSVQAMSESLKVIGQLDPIKVRPLTEAEKQLNPGLEYIVLGGHRRREGALALGWTVINALVLDIRPEDTHLRSVMDNAQEDMDWWEWDLAIEEEARINPNLTQEDIGKRLDKSQTKVFKAMKITWAFNQEAKDLVTRNLDENQGVGEGEVGDSKNTTKILKNVNAPRIAKNKGFLITESILLILADLVPPRPAASANPGSSDMTGDFVQQVEQGQKTLVQALQEVLDDYLGEDKATKLVAWIKQGNQPEDFGKAASPKVPQDQNQQSPSAKASEDRPGIATSATARNSNPVGEEALSGTVSSTSPQAGVASASVETSADKSSPTPLPGVALAKPGRNDNNSHESRSVTPSPSRREGRGSAFAKASADREGDVAVQPAPLPFEQQKTNQSSTPVPAAPASQSPDLSGVASAKPEASAKGEGQALGVPEQGAKLAEPQSGSGIVGLLTTLFQPRLKASAQAGLGGLMEIFMLQNLKRTLGTLLRKYMLHGLVGVGAILLVSPGSVGSLYHMACGKAKPSAENSTTGLMGALSATGTVPEVLRIRMEAGNQMAQEFAEKFYSFRYLNTAAWMDDLNRDLTPGYSGEFFNKFCPPARIEDIRNRQLTGDFHTTQPVKVLGLDAMGEEVLVVGMAEVKSDLHQSEEVLAQGPVEVEVHLAFTPNRDQDAKINLVDEKEGLAGLGVVNNFGQAAQQAGIPTPVAAPISSSVRNSGQDPSNSSGRSSQHSSSERPEREVAVPPELQFRVEADGKFAVDFARIFYAPDYSNTDSWTGDMSSRLSPDYRDIFFKELYPEDRVKNIRHWKLFGELREPKPAKLLGISEDGEDFLVEGTAVLAGDTDEPNNVLAEGPVALILQVIHDPADNPDGKIDSVKEIRGLKSSRSLKGTKRAAPRFSSGKGPDGVDAAANFMGDVAGEAAKKAFGF